MNATKTNHPQGCSCGAPDCPQLIADQQSVAYDPDKKPDIYGKTKYHPINRTKAKTILGDEYIDGLNWMVASDESGKEFLVAFGYDEPFAMNRTSTSWL